MPGLAAPSAGSDRLQQHSCARQASTRPALDDQGGSQKTRPAPPGSPATLAFHTVRGYSRTKCCASARPNSSGLQGEVNCEGGARGRGRFRVGRGGLPAPKRPSGGGL